MSDSFGRNVSEGHTPVPAAGSRRALREGYGKAKKIARRALPALLALVVVLSGSLIPRPSDLREQGASWGGKPSDVLLTPPASPLALSEESCSAVGDLVAISEQAAALTGSLALVEKDRRAQAASRVTAEIHSLRDRAATLSGGMELAGVLGDLADALAGYAGGESSALGRVREASARNARVREGLYQRNLECGGVSC